MNQLLAADPRHYRNARALHFACEKARLAPFVSGSASVEKHAQSCTIAHKNAQEGK
jgi:hypothetical protein